MNAQPYDFDEAREAINVAKAVQAGAEDAVREAYRQFAAARKAYQLAFAQAIVEARAELPATVALDMARGTPKVAQLRYEKDVAEGVMEAAKSAIWRHTADRKDLARLVDWSIRVAPDGQHDDESGRLDVIGGRRAS